MTYTLAAVMRKEKGPKIRVEGKIPAVVYGSGSDADSLALEYGEFEKLYRKASESSVIDLVVDGKEAGKVLLQDVQFDPLSGRFLHVDLHRLDMKKPITAWVELEFVGEAPAVKGLGGTFVHNTDEFKVKCLPGELITSLSIDISILNTFDDVIRVSDVKVPAGMVVLSPNANDVVAKVMPALTEDQIKAMEAASTPVDLTKIEQAGKKKEDPEAVVEGGDEKPKKEEKK